MDILLICEIGFGILIFVSVVVILHKLIFDDINITNIPMNYSNDVTPLKKEDVVEEEKVHKCNYRHCKCDSSCKNKINKEEVNENDDVIIPDKYDKYIKTKADMIKKENIVASSAKHDDNVFLVASSLIAEETQQRTEYQLLNSITKDTDEDNHHKDTSHNTHQNHSQYEYSPDEYHNGHDHSSHSHNYVDSYSNIHDSSSASYDSSGSSFFD